MPPIRVTVRVHWFGFVFQFSEIASFIFSFVSRVCKILHDSEVKTERSLTQNLPVCSLSLRMLCTRPGLSSVAFVQMQCMPGGFSGGSDGKESACSTGDLGSILGWKDPLEEGMAPHSSISVWRIPTDRGAWWATVHGVTKSQTRLK